MPAQDYGDLSDYVVNGDNFTRLNPQTGSTLVIPGQYGQQPLVASELRDTYRPLGGSGGICALGNCALFAHDVFTGQYVILKIASFDQLEEDCRCALAGMFLSSDTAACQANLQAFVDASTGQILFDVFPEWLLQELNLLELQFTAVVAYDFWFTGCYGDLLSFPNLPATPPSTSACVQIGRSCWARI